VRIGILGLLLALALSATTAAQTVPSPPGQPTSGPGGADLPYSTLSEQVFEQTWPRFRLFVPDGTGDTALPLVLFLGGCCMDDNTSAVPAFYRVWIEHTALKGAVVIYPTYRLVGAETDIELAVRKALFTLEEQSIALDLGAFVIVGHSFGSVMGAAYAGAAVEEGWPQPAALLLTLPGCGGCSFPSNLDQLAPETKLVVVTGAADVVARSRDANRIWNATPQIPDENRIYLHFVSDSHGSPALVADHGFPTTGSEDGASASKIDALDWYGTWKLTDALLSCVSAGSECEVALGSDAGSMGVWSDGRPVAPAIEIPVPLNEASA
jgi:hypothetical protein